MRKGKKWRRNYRENIIWDSDWEKTTERQNILVSKKTEHHHHYHTHNNNDDDDTTCLHAWIILYEAIIVKGKYFIPNFFQSATISDMHSSTLDWHHLKTIWLWF